MKPREETSKPRPKTSCESDLTIKARFPRQPQAWYGMGGKGKLQDIIPICKIGPENQHEGALRPQENNEITQKDQNIPLRLMIENHFQLQSKPTT